MKKKILAALMTVAALVMIAGCGSSGDKTTDSSKDDKDLVQTIKDKGELVVGTSADFAPFEFHTMADGKDQIVGADIDLAQAIADEFGVKLVVKDMEFNTVLASLQKGQVDIALSGISATPERQKTFDFSIPYYNPPQRLLINTKNVDTFKTIADFDGKKVGAQKGSIQEDVVKEQLADANLVSIAKVPNLINELKQGSIDGLVLEETIAQAYIDQNPDIQFADIELKSNSDEAFAIALPKDSGKLKEEIDSILQKLIDDGSIDTFVEKNVVTADQTEATEESAE